MLEPLERLLRSGPRMWLRRGERFFELRSSDFDSETDAAIVRTKADHLISWMSGYCRLMFGLNGRIRLRGVKREEEGKPPTQFLFIDELISDGWVGVPQLILEGGSQPSKGILETTLALVSSGNSDVVERVLRLWDLDASFRNLTPILEIIGKDIGARAGIAKRGWASKAKVDGIFRTAQSPSVLGDKARHGIEKGAPPSNPISLEEARETTEKIIRAWVAEKSTAET